MKTAHAQRVEFQENGFVVLKDIHSKEKLQEIHYKIMTELKSCATELNCSLGDYLANVSRWLDPSPITSPICPLAEAALNIVQNFIGEEVKLSKISVISKTAYANGPVPCHQDIAYSRKAPYEFSLWLPLQDVSLAEGPLELLPSSHLEKIEPAVDFWQPNFIDKMYLSPRWQQSFVALPLCAGDAIVFDSRIWHRSHINLSGKSRFTMVTRWSRKNYCSPGDIPEKLHSEFGMWTAGTKTESILQQGLLECFQLNTSAGLTDILQLWQEKLSDHLLPFQIDVVQAKRALNNLWILDKAAQLHNGGDAQGVVYPNLWHHFLNPLTQWLEVSQCHSKEPIYEQAV